MDEVKSGGEPSGDINGSNHSEPCCPAPSGSCWSFDASVEDGNAQKVMRHNEQVSKLVEALGASGGAGRRAILAAVAEKQGITEDEEVDAMMRGDSEVKLRVPASLRPALCSVGLEHMLAPINLFTIADETQEILLAESWKDIEFEVALDSGSVVHVCAPVDVPGYKTEESAGSKRKQNFLMGDGGEIPNLGQSKLNLSDEDCGRDIQSIFQIAAVTRPLMSVGKICDEGHSITFSAVMAAVHDKEGEEVCRFNRAPGGLYVAKLKLKSPAGFGGQE